MLPKISTVIPSSNARHFLWRGLDSLAVQGYPNLEVIVVDGGSTDGTMELLKDRADIVTKLVSDRDRGQTDALDKGFDAATEEVLGG